MRRLLFLLILLAAMPARALEYSLDTAASDVMERFPDFSVLWLGELHGTREAPALALAIAQRAVAAAPLRVALEIDVREQARIDAWLDSAGFGAHWDALLTGAFWNLPPSQSDGRRSTAMFELLDGLRRLCAEGHALDVIAFDERPVRDGDSHAVLAEALRTLHAQRPNVRLLVLTGNYHAKLALPGRVLDQEGTPIQPPEPTAARLRELAPVSIDITAREGGFWNFGERPLASAFRATDPGLYPLDPERDGHHARVVLPGLSPSPPVAASGERAVREVRRGKAP